MNMDTLANAFEGWVNTFDVSRPCRYISDLSDGIVLSEVVADIDPTWFRLPRPVDGGDNWVHKYNHLKKLYKLVGRYLEEKLGQSLSKLDPPNLSAIAKEGSALEVLKLCELVIAVAVQCERNQHYIQKVQSLPQSSQHALMISLERIIEALNSEPTQEYEMDEIRGGHGGGRPLKRRAGIEQSQDTLMADYEVMSRRYNSILAEKEALKQKIQELERSSKQGNHKSDVVLRAEIDHLRQSLEKSEYRRQEQEIVINDQLRAIADLSRSEAELSAKADEAGRLKDKLDEYKHAIDKLQKTENVIERYKRKLEEAADLQRQFKTVEAQNQELLERNKEIEEEYRKVAAFKSIVETYKAQILALEAKNSAVAKEKNRAEYDGRQKQAQIQQLEATRAQAMAEVRHLEEQVRELEHASNASQADHLREVEMENLERSLTDQYQAQAEELQNQIEELEREVQALQEEREEGRGPRVTMLQHLLDDANKLKSKYEQDFLEEHQEKVVLQGELDKLRVTKGDESAVAFTLRSSLNAREKELAETKRTLVSAKADAERKRMDLERAQTDLDRTRRDLEKAQGDAERLGEELEAAQNDLRTAESERDAARDSWQANVDEALSTFSDEHQQISQKANMLESENHEYQVRLEEAEKERDELRDLVRQLRRDMQQQAQESTQAQSTSQQERRDITSKELSRLQEELNRVSQESSRLAATNSDYQAQLEKVLDEKDGLSDLVKEQRETIRQHESARVQGAVREAGRISASAELLRLSGEREALLQKVCDLEEEYDSWKTTSDQMTAQNEQLRTELQEAKDVHAALLEKVQEEFERHETVHAQEAEDSALRSDLEEKNKQLEDRIALMEGQMQQFSDKLEQASAEKNQIVRQLQVARKERDDAERNAEEARAVWARQEAENTRANEDSESRNVLDAKNRQLEQQILEMTAQMQQFGDKLERAKEFIVQQDTIIKEAKAAQSNAESYSEAIGSIQNELRSKDEEIGTLKRKIQDVRNQAQREQKLMASALQEQLKKGLRENLLSQQRRSTPAAAASRRRGT